tara:strand:+ start:1411 stop:1947 length:537 start_codon:yes stop_codon:yes gene_type:complete
MKITKKDLLRVIREEAAKSTKKYDDAKELKGDQDELPDALQKGIIDKAKKEKKNEMDEMDEMDEMEESVIRFTREELAQIIREEISLEKEPTTLDATGLADMIVQMVQDDEPRVMGHGGEASMARQQLQQIASMAQSLHDKLNDEDELPEWTQSKIAVAEDNIDAIADHLGYKMNKND